MNWELTENGFNSEKIAHLGNKFLTGNGYMGIRGTLDEFDSRNLVAVNLAGIYDQVGNSWREPLNAPNGFYSYLIVDGNVLKVQDNVPKEHFIKLDYRHGIFKRHTEWTTKRGNIVLESERFVSMDDIHVGAEKYKITADFHADINFVTGIDGDVWDINGPHYDELIMDEDDCISIVGISHEKKYHVAVSISEDENFPCEKKTMLRNEDKKIIKSLNFVSDINKCYEIHRFMAIYTSKDCENPLDNAKETAINIRNKGYYELCDEHCKCWESIWNNSEVEIEGDDDAMEALNYSCYHLNSISPRYADSLSIAARGLSGQTYKGAVFWDTEMFILDFLLMTNPKVARNVMKYRIDTLDGAKEKAKSYGYDGAFYAWESQEGGFDACSDYNVTDVFTKRPMRTYFKDKQIHISAAIVYGIGRYIDLTGDMTILSEGGAETIIECAKFYYDLLLKKVSGGYYELHDVIGPDEYHERVNNNGYTNRMAKYTFEQAVKVIDSIDELNEQYAIKLCKEYNLKQLKEKFEMAERNIYIPQPNENGIIPQFDGYFDLEDVSVNTVRSRLLDPKEYWGGANGVAAHTQVIKQADVVTWLTMFPDDVSDEIKLKNWQYYEPRTEHGSSLSACMYALLACKCGMKEKAYPLFMKSASADLNEGGKEWAGLVYIGGTHPAAEGGAYMVAIKGFAGIYFEDGKIKAKPDLPKAWKKMRFHICYRNKKYKIEIEDNNANIVEI